MPNVVIPKGTIQKSTLIDEIYQDYKGKILKKDIETIVDTFLNSVITNLAVGNKVTLSGFGTFEVRERKGRVGTNPRTKQKMIVKEQKNVYFKTGKILKNRTNNQIFDEDF